MEKSGQLAVRREQRMRTEVLNMIQEDLAKVVREKVTETPGFDEMISDIHARKSDPYSIVNSVMSSILKI